MVRPLNDKDFDGFEPIDVQRQDFEDMKALILGNDVMPHQGCACNSKGEPVLLFGFVEVWPRVFEVWTLFSKKWRKTMYATAREWTANYCRLLDFDRIQHTISEDRPWMHRVIQYMGFKCETDIPLRKYRDGKDCYVYSIIKEDVNGY